MANIIAIVWDFDKTLVDGYMQDPIFEEYGVDPKQFWQEVNGLPEKYQKEQNVKVNKDKRHISFKKFIQLGRKQEINIDNTIFFILFSITFFPNE